MHKKLHKKAHKKPSDDSGSSRSMAGVIPAGWARDQARMDWLGRCLVYNYTSICLVLSRGERHEGNMTHSVVELPAATGGRFMRRAWHDSGKHAPLKMLTNTKYDR